MPTTAGIACIIVADYMGRDSMGVNGGLVS